MKKSKRVFYNKFVEEDGAPRCHFYMIYKDEIKLSRINSIKCYDLESAIFTATKLGWKTIKGIGKYQNVLYTNGVFNEQKL